MTAREMKQNTQKGMTLIELMVALAIGMFLMIGAMTVFMQGRTTFRLTESISRLQENARFALDTMEPDIRMAQYWGLTNRSEMIRGRATENPIATAATCGATWVNDLDNAIVATSSGAWACMTNAQTGANSADSFVVRRVAEDSLTAAQVNALGAAPNANTLFVRTYRGGGIDGDIFIAPAPTNFDPLTQEMHRLVVNGYYISTQSQTLGATVPSLRMRSLAANGVVEEREVLPGVEDMQLQFGIDTDVAGAPDRGAIDRWVNPGDALIATSVVLAVRLWVRVRAERAENGFVDGTTYNYADENQTYNDNFRRVVVSKTLYLRNARI